MAGLQGIPVPVDAMQDWYRMFDNLTDNDLMTDTAAELSLASGIRRNGRTDGLCTGTGPGVLRYDPDS